ncbi:hypothetical protein MMC28_006837 [Mycoblastus sanguinarius]|nr:hypothetical protein [Mycoblastus sanguinarius]
MSQSNKRPILLLLDWDGTLITQSTLPLIASIATFPDIHPALAGLSKDYSDDLKRHDETYRLKKNGRKTVGQELAYLDSLRGVERKSIERVEAAGIFKNVCTGDIDIAASGAVEASSITMRKGWARLCEVVQARPAEKGVGEMGIVSVAWSRRFIAGVLGEMARRKGCREIWLGDVSVWSNEIAEDRSGRMDRYFSDEGGGVWTAGDKARILTEAVKRFAAKIEEGKREETGEATDPLTLYIGDSPTDLACLLKADMGICVRDRTLTSEQKELNECLERVGVACGWVGEWKKDAMEVEHTDKKKLWWARDFDELCESGLLDGA